MIFDTLSNLGKYTALNQNFAAAFDFLLKTDLKMLSGGRHEVIDGKINARVIDRSHLLPEQLKLESHKKFIDLHVTVTGLDRVGWRAKEHSAQDGEYVEATDDFFYSDPAHTVFDVSEGYFALFFPQDAHWAMGGEGHIKKVVLKITVE